MAKGLLGGMTDYSHQSFDDIIEDLDHEFRNISAFIDAIEKNIKSVQESGYWQDKVLSDFKMIVGYSLKHYKTSQKELVEIKDEIQKEVQEHHCKRLSRISSVAHEINIDIGKIWHQEYHKKEYGNNDFSLVERIYADTRDMAVNLLDISNISERLKDFVGKKGNIKDKIVQKEFTKILFLSSSPNDESRIRVDLELRKIEDSMEAAKFRDKISLNSRIAVKPETISKAMLDFNPHIVHFSGHGDIDGIAIEDDEGKSKFFPAKGLERLFSLFKDSTKCVILNTCYSEEQAEAISNQGIYVIGMNDSIGDDAAIKFSMGFYQAIGTNKEVPFAFQMGMVLISQFVGDSDTPTLWKDGKKLN